MSLLHSLSIFKKTYITKRFASNSPKIYKFLLNKWYFDEVYERFIITPYRNISSFAWKKIDNNIIDNLGPNGLANISRRIAGQIIIVRMDIFIDTHL